MESGAARADSAVVVEEKDKPGQGATSREAPRGAAALKPRSRVQSRVQSASGTSGSSSKKTGGTRAAG